MPEGAKMEEEQANNIIKAVARYDAAVDVMLNMTERTLRNEAIDVRDKINVIEEFIAARQSMDNVIMTRGIIV